MAPKNDPDVDARRHFIIPTLRTADDQPYKNSAGQRLMTRHLNQAGSKGGTPPLGSKGGTPRKNGEGYRVEGDTCKENTEGQPATEVV